MAFDDQVPEPAGEPGTGPVTAETVAPVNTVLPQLAAMHPGRLAHAERSVMGGELVIGHGIQVKGKVGACRTLVVEGELDAAVEVQCLRLLECGLFKGGATVETAELAGQFDGELVVKGKLHLKPSARVSGQIRYHRIEIEEGGEISGDVAALAKGRSGSTASR